MQSAAEKVAGPALLLPHPPEGNLGRLSFPASPRPIFETHLSRAALSAFRGVDLVAPSRYKLLNKNYSQMQTTNATGTLYMRAPAIDCLLRANT